jgi:Patatin-like phospholipase
MPKRLAITVAGAVSLGSYEAGVLYEIFHAISQHNLDPATSDAEKIVVDVLTGASAGGMTATIAAQKLLFEADALAGPYNNSFYRPWVVDVDLESLLTLQSDEDPTHSIFSSDLVQDISRRYITQRYKSHVDIPRRKHPAAADVVHLGLALANLNGIDYGLPLLPKPTTGPQPLFVYTRYQDQLKISLRADSQDDDDTFDTWEPLRLAAVSCGAFAFAFRVVDLVRHAAEYAESHPVSQLAPTELFTYTDGGTFQNEPLGMAKDLVDLIDNHQNVESRFYLFVSPGSRDSTANRNFHEAQSNLLTTGATLVGAIFNQARFHDWVQAEEVNKKIFLLNDRAISLQRDLKKNSGESGHIDFGSLAPAATALLGVLFPNDQGPTNETRGEAWARLQQQFRAEYQDLRGVKGQQAADTWIDSVLAFETAAQLGPQDEMAIYGITAESKELASFELAAFAGFFDRRYRDHDYDVGRAKAQAFLGNPGGLGPIRYQPETINPIDHSLNNLNLTNMDSRVRERVRDRLRERAKDILAELKIGDQGFVGDGVRDVIDLAFIKPQLDKLLRL